MESKGIVLILIKWTLICVSLIIFLYSLIDYFFIFDGIKSDKPITPKIELIVKNNTIDTIYVYEQN